MVDERNLSAKGQDLSDPLEETDGELSLKQIFNNTIDNIEKSKGQIFEIYESTKQEVDNCRRHLEDVRKQALESIKVVDRLAKQEQSEKQRLVKVSSNFTDYSEDKIKECYEAVKNVQVMLGVEREKEFQYRSMRDRMELRLKRLEHTLDNAEHLAMQIGSVMGYLTSQLSDAVVQMEKASKNKFLGIQIIRAQEDERYRVSREIHDGPAQELANLIYQSSICERLVDRQPDEAKASLQELRRQIRQCLTDVRQVIFDMRPMSLDDLGLIPALRQLILKMKDRGMLDATLQVDGKEKQLEKHVEVGIFRIIQESLNNVCRHAETKTANVRILFTESHMALLIADNGKGFNQEELEEKRKNSQGGGHFGMTGMEERAKIIGAELTVTSEAGKGTRVHLNYPYPDIKKSGGVERKS